MLAISLNLRKNIFTEDAKDEQWKLNIKKNISKMICLKNKQTKNTFRVIYAV